MLKPEMARSSISFHCPQLLLLLITTIISLFFQGEAAQPSLHPKALVLPVAKDSSTLQYLTTSLGQRTPPVYLPLVVDLGGQYLWNDCETGFVSSSHKVVQCRTASCSLSRSQECGYCFRPVGPDCGNTSCKIWPNNPVRQFATNGDLIQDVLVIRSTDGSNPGGLVKASKFLTGCTGTNFLELLANGANGMAGLGRADTSMPSQLAATFSFDRKFAVCLGRKGVVLFGDGPYHFLPNDNIDFSKSLTYTPLLGNKVSTAAASFPGEPSTEYFIGVKSIKVNDKPVSVNSTLLKINSQGYGGTKLSSVNPYTVMESSIYAAVTTAFRIEMARFQTVPAVAPFALCYNSTHILYNQEGPDVPRIDLVLQSSKVYWRIYGTNSMVKVSKDVLCLGIIDGGLSFQTSPETSTGLVTSIVIGGHQLENNLLQFDLAASKLGFSSSLLQRQTTCSGFNFTSTA
uniref:Peptidase A1 domain-containing protein n=1 Tax=Kalanchoe fedtschenkoi TaxID=63787 RepID=A0A7N1A8E0_KALFE